MSLTYAEVLLETAPGDLQQRSFTYAVPASLAHAASLGTPVLVPFGHQTLAGFIVALSAVKPDRDVRPILAAIDGADLPADLLAMLRWASHYYIAPFANLIHAAVPPGVLGKAESLVTAAAEMPPTAVLPAEWRPIAQMLRDEPDGVSLRRLRHHFGAANSANLAIRDWRRRHWIQVVSHLAPPKDIGKHQLMIRSTNGSAALTPRQDGLYQFLVHQGGAMSLSRFMAEAGTTAATARSLERKGAVAIARERILRVPGQGPVVMPGDHEPTIAQVAALAVIREARLAAPKTVLLHGVTGSGKTDVYLAAIAEVLADGETALVLVPEISLTPQLVARFRGRFGAQVAILHSALGSGERGDQWARIRAGLAPVVVGTRSAIFAPVPQLGLIILDEEHDPSYKQDTQPRYHARTLAWKRAELTGATVILGSATPSAETFAAALGGHVRLAEMPERVASRPLPGVRTVDMRDELANGRRSPISRVLELAIGETLAQKEQVILFLNRRGFARVVFCRHCGAGVHCPHCAIALTYHQDHFLLCHLCGHKAPWPEHCPSCRFPTLRHKGTGTQKVETMCQSLWPDARILRLDRDTTVRKDSHQTILTAFGNGEADILIGTQMVTKGLDFPDVTLVGVLVADFALHVPDFRAGERTFQLLTQVAGRAGRGVKPGRVVVQTYDPENRCLQAACKHDYAAFIAPELLDREALGYPPYLHLINLLITSENDVHAANHAQRLADAWRAAPVPGLHSLLGPVPAAITRIRDQFRHHLLIKCESLSAMQKWLPIALRDLPPPPGVTVAVDVDPQHLG
ncbi:MAG: primosomal protein N' [Candidatus Sericytochromatia bacterium]|nr:primosomal protein N' [Candidatus Sericytochromatia bacterium]